MKQILLILMVFILTACTESGGHGRWTVEHVHREADIVIPQVKLKQQEIYSQPRKILVVYSHEYGSFFNKMMDGWGGNRVAVRQALLLVQNKSNNCDLLYLANSVDMDYAVIANAAKDLDLTGFTFFFAGRPDDREKIEPLIKTIGANFVFIDKDKAKKSY